MKQLSLLLLLYLGACANIESKITPLRYNEVLGSEYKHLNGKLFEISCGGNEYTTFESVKNTCLNKISEFVYKKSFKYFSVLSQDSNTDKTLSGYLLNGVWHTRTVKRYEQQYMFILIDENETSNYKNFYKVSDYYTQESENK